MSKLIFKIYQKILWLAGFPGGEYITFMLRRQEARLGLFWWLSIGATIGYITVLLHNYLSTPWFILSIFPVNELCLVLVWHVVRTPEPNQNIK